MKRQKLEKKVLGDKKIEAHDVDDLAEPKDKWKQGRKLLELKKQFPHDRVLERMIEQEFKDNRPFKRPEEYDIYDVKEENARRMVGETQEKKANPDDNYEILREKFRNVDGKHKFDRDQK